MKKFLNKNKEALGGVIIIIIAFYCGRYSAPTKTEIKTVTIEVEKVKQKENKVVIEKVNKDGSKVIITKVNTETEKDSTKSSETSKIVEKKSPVNIHAMGGLDFTNPASGFIVGVHASKQLLGPISLGVFGFTNKTLGLSVGLSF